MNTAEVDIDRLVDYKSEYTQYINLCTQESQDHRRSVNRTLPVP